MPSALLLTCEPIPLVRIALIGLGDRGMKTLRRYAFIPHAEIRYVVDLDSEKTEAANAALTQSGRPAAIAFCGAEAWKTVCEKEDVDLVYVCTEWNTHTPMAVYAIGVWVLKCLPPQPLRSVSASSAQPRRRSATVS